MISPWTIELNERNGYPFTPLKKIQVADPTSFVEQKILIHHERGYDDRVKDLLYVHDTVELFSEHLRVCVQYMRRMLGPGFTRTEFRN